MYRPSSAPEKLAIALRESGANDALALEKIGQLKILDEYTGF